MTERTPLLSKAFSIALIWPALLLSSAQWRQQSSNTAASFRGLCAVSDQIAWASGTKGTFIRTVDGGKTWQAGAVPGAEQLDFRDVEAFDGQTAYLLSIGNGESSRIYKTTDGGQTWKLQFKGDNPDLFLDAMAFWDSNHGIAMGDPINGRFVILTTDDGGASWKRLPPEESPPALPREAAFAASGTCITIEGKRNVWIATGGGAARVFRSTDRGRTWSVADTPLLSNAESAGIFSIAFCDALNGVVVGGDYRKPAEARWNAAITNDGGRNWKLLDASKPSGFRSGVAWVRSRQGTALVAVGTSGSDYSLNNGRDWVGIDREDYNSISAAASGAVWAVGPGGRLARFSGELQRTR